MAQNSPNAPFQAAEGMRTPAASARTGGCGVTRNGKAPSSSSPVLPPGRLDPLIRRIAGLLRKAFLSAEEGAYVIRRARAKAGIRGRPVTPKRLPEILTLAELHGLLAEAYRERPRDGLLIRLLFESAVRVAEVSRLDVPDLDLTERTVRVREGKGRKDRVALIGEDLAQLVRVHLAGRTRGPLFTSTRGTRLSVRRIQSVVSGAARRAGVTKARISPHSLRHTWATMARNKGMALDSVQAVLGHASPRTTLIYSRLATDTLRDEYDRTMAAIAGTGPGSAALVPIGKD